MRLERLAGLVVAQAREDRRRAVADRERSVGLGAPVGLDDPVGDRRRRHRPSVDSGWRPRSRCRSRASTRPGPRRAASTARPGGRRPRAGKSMSPRSMSRRVMPRVSIWATAAAIWSMTPCIRSRSRRASSSSTLAGPLGAGAGSAASVRSRRRISSSALVGQRREQRRRPPRGRRWPASMSKKRVHRAVDPARRGLACAGRRRPERRGAGDGSAPVARLPSGRSTEEQHGPGTRGRAGPRRRWVRRAGRRHRRGAHRRRRTGRPRRTSVGTAGCRGRPAGRCRRRRRGPVDRGWPGASGGRSGRGARRAGPAAGQLGRPAAGDVRRARRGRLAARHRRDPVERAAPHPRRRCRTCGRATGRRSS